MKKRKIFSLLLCLTLVFICIFVTSCAKSDVTLDDEIVSHARPIELKMMRLANTTQDGVVVNATVNPSTVINDKLNWSLEWVSTSSENVSDYVTMQVSADTHSVTLTYKKNFTKQLILKATSVLTPSINSTCTIDCYKRTNNFSLDFGFETQDDDFIPIPNESQKTVDFSKMPYIGLTEYHVTDCDLFGLTQTGTVNVTNKKIVKFSLSTELKTKLTQAGITIKANSTDEQQADEFIGLSINLLLNELINITEANKEQVFELLGTLDYWFDMSCTVKDMSGTTEVNSFNKTYKLVGFNISDGLSVTSVNLNKTNIIF